MICLRISRLILGTTLGVVLAAWTGVAAPAEAPRAILWYGNSFTSHHEVWKRFSNLAVKKGHPRPLLVLQLAGGRTTEWHLQQTLSNATANVSAKRIESFPGGFTDVIIQGQSLEATPYFRPYDPDGLVANAEKLFAQVKASANGRHAKCVLYETWARHPEHADYAIGMFADADAMQATISEGYRAAARRIAEKWGDDSVVVAPCGQAYRKQGFARKLYDEDFYHQSAAGASLLAEVLYTTVYETAKGGL